MGAINAGAGEYVFLRMEEIRMQLSVDELKSFYFFEQQQLCTIKQRPRFSLQVLIPPRFQLLHCGLSPSEWLKPGGRFNRV
jgi:hypothetical protein